MQEIEHRASAQERMHSILRTVDLCGGLHSGELDGRTMELMRRLRRSGEVNSIQLIVERNGKRIYGHYSLFKPNVKPGSIVYFRERDELFAHWFATNLLRGGISHWKLLSLGTALERMGFDEKQREMILVEANGSYGKSKTYSGIRRRNKRAETLALLDQSTVLHSAEMSVRQKALLNEFYEQDKIKRVKFAKRGSGTNPRLKGHYELFKPNLYPCEHIYFRKFSLAVAKWMADLILQPVDQGSARALTHALKRMGFEESEATLIIAIAYPGYYISVQDALK